MSTSLLNWAGTHTFRPSRVHEPSTLDELRSIVAASPKIHATGSRHCFNDIADAPELLTLDRMPQTLEIDRAACTVTINAGMRYETLNRALHAEGFALHNLASLTHISVMGAVATATHGSGDTVGNLASAVQALELVTSSGEVITSRRGDPDFPGLVVNLGALGVVTRLTLSIEPAYDVQQQVFDHLSWDVLFDRFDEITSGADSVSLFTDYGATVNQVWVKNRVRPGGPAVAATGFFGAPAADARRNPVVEFSAENCNEQLAIPGPWCDRLPHVAYGAVTERGDHIQSEYMVERKHGVAAVAALKALSAEITPRLNIAEIRTVGGDDLWLSSSYGGNAVCLHFSWTHDLDAVLDVLPAVESALRPFSPRPHWGKVFLTTAAELEPRYPRFADFRALRERLDPRDAFRTPFVDRVLYA